MNTLEEKIIKYLEDANDRRNKEFELWNFIYHSNVESRIKEGRKYETDEQIANEVEIANLEFEYIKPLIDNEWDKFISSSNEGKKELIAKYKNT